MAKSLNRCTFIGRLTRDTEMRYMPDGTAVAKFSIAVQDDYKDKSGQKVERAEFVPIVAYGKLAEICGQYLTKGKEVYVDGMFTTRKWSDNDGKDRWTTEVKLENMQMLGGKGDGGQSEGAPAPRQQGSGRPAAPAARPAPRQAPNFSDMDDDIPF
jgi:single-strand DNA-binding protein